MYLAELQTFAAESSLIVMGNETTKTPLNFSSAVLTVIPALSLDEATFTQNILVLTESGALYVYSFEEDTTACYLPGIIGPSQLVASKLYTVSFNSGEELNSLLTELSCDVDYPILTGGLLYDDEMYGLYITVHDDGLIHLWGISPSKMKHLYTLSLISDWAFPYKPQTRMAFI